MDLVKKIEFMFFTLTLHGKHYTVKGLNPGVTVDRVV